MRALRGGQPLYVPLTRIFGVAVFHTPPTLTFGVVARFLRGIALPAVRCPT